MPKRQNRLTELLDLAGMRPAREPLPRVTLAVVEATGLRETLDGAFDALGGHEFSFRSPAWDIQLEDLAVELDEERHFNRYRAVTLASPVYRRLRGFPHASYQAHSALREDACLKAADYGGYWTTPSSERQFGPSSEEGDLTGSGSARWKQRAFYDFARDLAPLALCLRVARVSVWDELEPGKTLQELLARHGEDSALARRLGQFVQERTVTAS